MFTLPLSLPHSLSRFACSAAQSEVLTPSLSLPLSVSISLSLTVPLSLYLPLSELQPGPCVALPYELQVQNRASSCTLRQGKTEERAGRRDRKREALKKCQQNKRAQTWWTGIERRTAEKHRRR